MGSKLRGTYDDALGLREVETDISETFEAEFPVVTGRTVTILSAGESPDRIALIGGIESGVELTAIKAAGAEHIIVEILRLARQKHEKYEKRGIFQIRPMVLLGHLDWPCKDVEGSALYDVHGELAELIAPSDFEGFGFSEIWLIDCGPKYTSRHDPRAPSDFFRFAPTKKIGFWQRERKRRPYGGLLTDFLT